MDYPDVVASGQCAAPVSCEHDAGEAEMVCRKY